MVQRILVLFCCMVFCVGILCGCKDSSEKAATEQKQQQTNTSEQYKKEAAKDINEDNMEEELSKLEAAIEQEASQEQ